MGIDPSWLSPPAIRSTSRERVLTVLRKTLLVATCHDIEIEPFWMTSGENCFADALSRFEADKLKFVAPQLGNDDFYLHQLHHHLPHHRGPVLALMRMQAAMGASAGAIGKSRIH